MRLSESFRGSVRITRGGAVVLEEARGEAGDGPCSVGTRYQVASVGKQFVAAAALLLGEAGRLPFDAPIARWIPGAPGPWRQITMHHLLTHTAGLGHWRDIPGFDIEHPPALDDLLDELPDVPLIAQPGASWSYSGPGYLLAARIVELVALSPYGDVAREGIFEPLGMSATTSGVHPAPGEAAHGFRDGVPVRVIRELTGMPGTGDVWSTVADLNRYGAALASGELLERESLARMFTAHAAIATGAGGIAASGYGYGCFIGTAAGRPARWHPGDNQGYRSLHAWLTGDETSIAILSNDETADLDGTLRAILS